MLSTLIGLIIILACILVFSYAPHASRRYCACGKKADIIDPERPHRVRCAGCHVKELLRKGEIL